MATVHPEVVQFLERHYERARQDVVRLTEQVLVAQRRLAEAEQTRDALKLLLDLPEVSTFKTRRSERQVEPTSDRFVGMTIRDATEAVMRAADRPMKAVEVVAELERGGLVMDAVKPSATVTSTLVRERHLYERVGSERSGLYRVRGQSPVDPWPKPTLANANENGVSGLDAWLDVPNAP